MSGGIIVSAGGQAADATLSDREGEPDADLDVTVERLLAGQRITVNCDAAAVDVLHRVGLDEHEVAVTPDRST